MIRTRKSCIAMTLLLVVVSALVYWPGLGGGFLFDDYPNILTNPRIQATSLTWDSLASAANAYGHGFSRPLATITFALNYIAAGKDPWAYKASGLAVHLINALLVFWLLQRLLALRFPAATWRGPAAFAIALIWSIHPLQVSTVLYVVQRMETLSLTFVLLALIAYLRGRTVQMAGSGGWSWIVGSALLAGIGLLSKESAALFPVYALAIELALLRFKAHDKRATLALKWGYGTLTAASVAIFAALVVPHYLAPEAYAFRDFTATERLLTQARVLPMYLSQMLLPIPGLTTFYYDDFQVSTGMFSPVTTFLGFSLLGSMAWLAWFLRNRAPLASLGIMWFFAAHLLTSNVFPIELAFEHRNYFALLGILLVAVEMLHRIPSPDGPRMKQIMVGVIIIGFAGLSLIRSATWGNPLLLATDMVERNPGSARASSDLAEQYMNMSGMSAASPFYAFAVQEFERGSKLPGASILPEQGLILLAASSGQPVKDEWWIRLIHKLSTQPVGPQDTTGVIGLVNHRYEGMPLDERRLAEAFEVAIARGQMPASAQATLGDFALKYLKDEALADRMFVAAVGHDPTDAAYAAQVFAALVSDGRIRQADLVFKRAAELGLMKHQQGTTSRPVPSGP